MERDCSNTSSIGCDIQQYFAWWPKIVLPIKGISTPFQVKEECQSKLSLSRRRTITTCLSKYCNRFFCIKTATANLWLFFLRDAAGVQLRSTTYHPMMRFHLEFFFRWKQVVFGTTRLDIASHRTNTQTSSTTRTLFCPRKREEVGSNLDNFQLSMSSPARMELRYLPMIKRGRKRMEESHHQSV